MLDWHCNHCTCNNSQAYEKTAGFLHNLGFQPKQFLLIVMWQKHVKYLKALDKRLEILLLVCLLACCQYLHVISFITFLFKFFKVPYQFLCRKVFILVILRSQLSNAGHRSWWSMCYMPGKDAHTYLTSLQAHLLWGLRLGVVSLFSVCLGSFCFVPHHEIPYFQSL